MVSGVGTVVESVPVDVAPVEREVRVARTSTAKAVITAERVKRDADAAYSEGLQAGSQKAKEAQLNAWALADNLEVTSQALDRAMEQGAKLRSSVSAKEAEVSQLRVSKAEATAAAVNAVDERDKAFTDRDLALGSLETVTGQRNFARWGWGITAAAFALCAYLRLKGIL